MNKKFYVCYRAKDNPNAVPSTWQVPNACSSVAEAKAKFLTTHPASKYQIISVYAK